jgi:hypothetical protein
MRNDLLAHGGDSQATTAPAASGGNGRPAASPGYRELLENMLDGPASPAPDRTSTETSAQGAPS